jgi:preprotein translocase subunit SecD
LAIYKLVPVTLTLAGIAGFILSLGMAVDANILIFARINEELKKGEPLRRAMYQGFSRAWLSIRDSHITTLIGAFVLYTFTTSIVKGFALTLGVGVLMSLVASLIITRTFLELSVGTRLEKWPWLFKSLK